LAHSACALAIAGLLPGIARRRAPTNRPHQRDRAHCAQQFEAARRECGHLTDGSLVPPDATRIDLSVTEATARALERNLDIAVERLNPQTFDLQISRLSAAYAPCSRRSSVSVPTSRRPPARSTAARAWTSTPRLQHGLTQALRLTGANLAFSFNNSKQVTTNSTSNYKSQLSELVLAAGEPAA
jgi:hypothetical protein